MGVLLFPSLVTDWLRNANRAGRQRWGWGKVRDGGMRPYERGGRDKEAAVVVMVVEGFRLESPAY